MGVTTERFSFNSLSVRSKLIIAFVSLTLLSVAVMSWIGYISARDSLRAVSEHQLMGLQRSKAAMVKATLDAARNKFSACRRQSLWKTPHRN